MTEPTDLDLFLMGNLSPKQTGLPYVVWISQSGSFEHDVWIWVSRTAKAHPSEWVSVAIRPDVRVVGGSLSAGELNLLKKWIDLNRDVLLKYWNGEIEYTMDAIHAIRPIET
jgi:hypothetical protein